jgi:hypothetical protein
MDFLTELKEIPSDCEVQKLNLYEVMNYIIDQDEVNQIKLLNLIVNELNLSSVSEYVKLSSKSYNGVKNFGNTVNIANKTFVINKNKDFI